MAALTDLYAANASAATKAAANALPATADFFAADATREEAELAALLPRVRAGELKSLKQKLQELERSAASEPPCFFSYGSRYRSPRDVFSAPEIAAAVAALEAGSDADVAAASDRLAGRTGGGSDGGGSSGGQAAATAKSKDGRAWYVGFCDRDAKTASALQPLFAWPAFLPPESAPAYLRTGSTAGVSTQTFNLLWSSPICVHVQAAWHAIPPRWPPRLHALPARMLASSAGTRRRARDASAMRLVH